MFKCKETLIMKKEHMKSIKRNGEAYKTMVEESTRVNII